MGELHVNNVKCWKYDEKHIIVNRLQLNQCKQSEKNNKCMFYNYGWLWKECTYCKNLHYIYVYIMQTNNEYHYVSISKNVTHCVYNDCTQSV